jgi:RNA polymerase sigma factor (sigma-70 family)
MTITCDPRSTKIDSIASHRYVLPTVQEITPVAPAASASELERVVRAAADGDRDAVSQLVQRFAPRVRSVARAHRLAAHDVEDVTQTTWLRLVEQVHTIRNPIAIGAWLESTARHECLRIIKKNARERPTDNELVFDAPVPMDEQPLPASGRWVPALDAAVKQLPGHQQQLLSMLFTDRSPRYTDISRALGMPIGSIGPTRARSLARLRRNRDLGDVVEECLLGVL